MSLAFCTWKQESMEHQKSMSQLLGDRMWDEYDMSRHMEILETKLAVLLFGKTLDKDYKVSLTNEERILVAMLRQKCEKHSGCTDKVRLAFIFVSVYIDDHSHTVVPLIRVMVDEERHTSNNTFIDHLGRVYKRWDDYRDNHTWKGCRLCVPSHGYYDCDEDNIVLWNHFERDYYLNIFENMTKFVSKACAVDSVVPIISCTSPSSKKAMGYAAVVTVATQIILDINSLYDMNKYEQPINLSDEQVTKLWLNILGNICSVGGKALKTFETWSIAGGRTIPFNVGIVIGGFKLTGGTIKGVKLLNKMLNLSVESTITEVCMYITDVFLFSHCVTNLNGSRNRLAIATLLPIPIEIIFKTCEVKYPSTTLCKDFKVHKESIRKIREIKLI